MTFDGIGSVPTGWISALNSGSLTVPSLALSTAQNQENSCSSGCNSLLTGPLVFSAANQSVNIEYDFASTGKDLTGKTISLYYYLDAAPSNAPYGQIYIQDTPNYNYQSVGFSSVINGTWTKVSIPANQGGVNPAKILKFGVQIGTGGTGTTFNTVNFYVDNVTIQ
jgi:hypothetical protein